MRQLVRKHGLELAIVQRTGQAGRHGNHGARGRDPYRERVRRLRVDHRQLRHRHVDQLRQPLELPLQTLLRRSHSAGARAP